MRYREGAVLHEVFRWTAQATSAKRLITQLGTPARAASGLAYITRLHELFPPSEAAQSLGIIMGPQQMVEADGGGLQLWDT